MEEQHLSFALRKEEAFCQSRLIYGVNRIAESVHSRLSVVSLAMK